jgi:hypothetical protein
MSRMMDMGYRCREPAAHTLTHINAENIER